MTARLRALAVAVVGIACLFGVSFGVLDLGLRSPSAADKIGVRLLQVLKRTRGVRAVLDVEGHRLRSTCRGFIGRDLLQLSDGTRIVIIGVHAYRTLPPRGSLIAAVSNRRELFAVHSTAALVSAQAAIAGSHALWAGILAARLEQANLRVQAVRFESRPAYEVRLSTKPLLELIVDQATLRPVAAVYRSQAVSASSRLLASRRAVGGC